MCRSVAFPAPDFPGLWVYRLADAFKTKLLENPRRGVSFGQRVSPDPPDSRSAFREFHQSRRHRTGQDPTDSLSSMPGGHGHADFRRVRVEEPI